MDEDHIPYFNKKDKDFEALQKIILNAKWLESLQHYVRFRWVEVVIIITTLVPYMWKFLPISPPAFIGETLLMNMMSIGIKYNTKVAGIGKFI